MESPAPAPGYVFDSNVIIDLEESRESAAAVAPLIDAWKTGTVRLAVTAVSASENMPKSASEAAVGTERLRAKISSAGL